MIKILPSGRFRLSALCKSVYLHDEDVEEVSNVRVLFVLKQQEDRDETLQGRLQDNLQIEKVPSILIEVLVRPFLGITAVFEDPHIP